jgi:transposase
MANQLKMAQIHAIQVLRARHWSQRRIARELGIHRETVARHLRLAREGPVPDTPGVSSKPAKVITGSDSQNRPNLPAGTSGPAEGVPARVISGASTSRSRCEPFREIIQSKLEQGLSAQRIWQDLRDEHGFADGYQSVQRFVRHLQNAHRLPFRRVECEPGQQAQVDFGTGAPVIIPSGQPLPAGVKTRRRRTHIFRMVLSHSRKAYSDVVYRQTTEQFIRCLENAFWYFGGVPRTLVIDNLKAAVTRAYWFDPELNPKIQSFCEHYGTVVLPTRPRTPRHKGKVERIVGYAQENALKGRTFSSLADHNEHLLEWERSVADTRIHGTTQKQVKKCFEDVERSTLLPLPVHRFPSFQEGRRKVNRDGHVEVDKAYYSVPPEYLGRTVWARWDSRLVRIFNHRFEQVAVHTRHDPGRFSTQDRHIPRAKRSGIERGAAYHLNKAGLIGPRTGRWAEQMLQQRGIEGIRVLMGLLSLSKRHPAGAIEQACETALTHGAYRLRTLRELLKRQGARQEQFAFIEEHPIIRSLSDYGDLVHAAFNEETR